MPRTPHSPSSPSDPPASGPARHQGLQVFLVVEAACLMIALVMPITPSRTGSKWNPASLFWPEPTYLHAVLVWFVATNLLLVIIGVVAWIALRLRPSRD